MTRDLFRRYVWLVDTVKNGKKMTFDEISRAWDTSSFNVDGSKLALRTFHNHREAIELLFGIRILCNRSSHHYYIPEETAKLTDLKLWMLQSLAFEHLVKLEGKEVESRIIVDETPEQKFGLISVIEAMKGSRTIRFAYPSDSSSGSTTVQADPYAIRFVDNTWYVLAKNKADGKLKMFSIPLITDLTVEETKFRLPDDFSASGYFEKFIGHNVSPDLKAETIKIKAKSDTRGLLKAKPLHNSQTEIQSHPDFSVFQIEAAPTDDFIGKLLSMGTDVEILAPESLKNNVLNKLKAIAGLYGSD